MFFYRHKLNKHSGRWVWHHFYGIFVCPIHPDYLLGGCEPAPRQIMKLPGMKPFQLVFLIYREHFSVTKTSVLSFSWGFMFSKPLSNLMSRIPLRLSSGRNISQFYCCVIMFRLCLRMFYFTNKLLINDLDLIVSKSRIYGGVKWFWLLFLYTVLDYLIHVLSKYNLQLLDQSCALF